MADYHERKIFLSVGRLQDGGKFSVVAVKRKILAVRGGRQRHDEQNQREKISA
ncbi:MAG: hypothetical protein IKO05_00475 [Selenomonadaceae bacterium]|nr:hypothetical protein [Selenomonadaceae bacterium]